MDSPTAVKALGALAHETRLEVFRRLIRAGCEGLPAGQLAEELGVPATTLSFHLAALANAGLVQSRRAGRSIVYAVAFGRMGELMGYLTAHCCQAAGESNAADHGRRSAGAVGGSPAARPALRARMDQPDSKPAKGARK